MSGELSECLSEVIRAEVRLMQTPIEHRRIREDAEHDHDQAIAAFLEALDEQIDRRAAWIAGTEKGK